MSSLTGALISAKYRVGRRLGEGGMGAVYLAEHVGIGRQVAMKVVRPELMVDPSAGERFTREARAAGSIQHRHVVNVTDFGLDRVNGQEIAYLVMEQLSGQTLEEVLHEQGSLPLRQVVDIVAQVATGLAAAHATGVVHRDLKPANIWLAPDARGGFHVTLLDFGIAKLRDDTMVSRPASAASAKSAATTEDADRTLVTQVGESIGTPAYMSPEQCVGDDVDARSDIYSLGVLVYQLLAGTLPFRGNATELLRQHFVAEVPSLPASANVPARVNAVVQRALSKDPAERFQSALSFSAALSAESMGFGESMRRALVVFADRFTELSTVGALMAGPGLIATVIGALAWRIPVIWLWLLVLCMVIATPLAMASVAAVFDDIRNRPFVTIGWRRIAEAVTGRGGGAVTLYWAWIRITLGHYVRGLRTSKGSGVRNMLLFIDAYRHREARTSPERIERMVQLLPTGAFATMAIAQLAATVLLPAAAMFAAYGVMRLPFWSPSGTLVVVGIAGSLAFTAALFLQVFIALVDVMLYDLAYDMTAA